MDTMRSVRVEERLGEIVQPALRIDGRHDRITTLAMSASMAAHGPGAKLMVLEDAGHVPVIPRGEVVAGEIHAHFAEGA
jgi:pimeloyl-ACP methyl ester carboxylesterase